MKKYVIKKKGEDVWVCSWNPVNNTFIVTQNKAEAMPFTLEPHNFKNIYDKLNEFEIVEL